MDLNKDAYRHKELADFLKTRRALISPAQAGLPDSVRRRTPGLRREEVAQLAGISVTWYTWLEQGRPIQVSAQVLESLAKVLLLNREEQLHLYQLANQPLPALVPVCQESISPTLQQVLDHLTICPSFIMDRRWNVLAWNQAAALVLGDFTQMNDRERNVVWAMFTSPYYRQLFVDWSFHAKSTLGRVRSAWGQYIEDGWITQLIEALKRESPEFLDWWSLHEIQSSGKTSKELQHPVAGRLNFESSTFQVADHSHLQMIVHIPDPGTDTADKMAVLLNTGPL